MNKQPPLKADYSGIEIILAQYREEIEKKISLSLQGFGKKTALKDACEYALLNGGKRFRPTIVLMVAKALGQGLDVWNAALAVEFFHTASLIADDLPCMDNDDERRNKPSLHKVYGEAVALLATYSLISAGYRSIYQNSQILENHRSINGLNEKILSLAIENATANTGILGATGGQFLDLFPPDESKETLLEILNKKTVTLFEVAFVLGWLFGGGDVDKLSRVKELAYHWGMAFQIVDDIHDALQDKGEGRAINLANALGLQEALKEFYKEIHRLMEALQELKLDSEEFRSMVAVLIRAAESL